MRINAWKESSKHEVFLQKDIRDHIELCSEFMALGAHGNIFFGYLQFWWMVSDAGGSKSIAQWRAVKGWVGYCSEASSRREMKPPHCTWAPGNCNSDSRPKWIGQFSVEEIAVNFWRADLQHVDMLECPNYQKAVCIPLCNLLQTTKMNVIHRLWEIEVVYGMSLTACGKYSMLWSEQKST